MMLLLASLAWSLEPPPRAELVLGGPKHTTLDLYRPAPGADKVYVLVGLPDGSEALFMVDTGASISVIHREVVERLGLPVVPVDGLIEGLSGSVQWKEAVLPKIKLGDFELRSVHAAVDVPGVPEEAGALPVAGILGANVWTDFTCVLDYPADVLELHVPGELHVPNRAAPLVLDGMHAYTPVDVQAADGTKARVALELDTGAHDLMFRGVTGEPFRAGSTKGVEPVIGIGANLDEVPLANFLRETRRVPLDRIKIGGRKLDFEGPARWYDAEDPTAGVHDLPGLLGYEAMAGYRAILDFPGEKFLLDKSRRVPRVFDANGAWLAKERAAHGDDPARAAIRARLQYAMSDVEGAKKTVTEGLAARPTDTDLLILSSWIQRNAMDWQGSLAALDAADPVSLAEEGEWVAFVDSLLFDGQKDRALTEARAALDGGKPADTGRDDLYVALSDALLAAGRPAEASAAIDEASEVASGGSGHLLRKARVAMAEGDRYGAIVALRDLIRLYPLNGTPMWLYATLVQKDDLATFKADIDGAIARLHPGDEPWDFVGAARRQVGDAAGARDAFTRGYERDCAPLPKGADRANCDAWYWALEGERLDEAQANITAALTERPWASAYHDTAAMVAMAAGNTDEARKQAELAARLSPGDPYLLWQIDRLGATLTPSLGAAQP